MSYRVLYFFAMKPRGLNSYFVFNKYSFKRNTWKKEYVVWILPTIRVCRFVTGQEGGQVILWRLEGGEVEIEKILQPEIGPISAIQVQIRGTRSERWILSTTYVLEWKIKYWRMYIFFRLFSYLWILLLSSLLLKRYLKGIGDNELCTILLFYNVCFLVDDWSTLDLLMVGFSSFLAQIIRKQSVRT